jgi:hypothetical protein
VAAAGEVTRRVSDGLLIVVIGTGVGGLAGIVCAILTGLVLAAGRRYFERHRWVTRTCAGTMCGLLLAALTLAALQVPATWPPGVSELIAAAFCVSAAAGAVSANYVVTGRRASPRFRRTV